MMMVQTTKENMLVTTAYREAHREAPSGASASLLLSHSLLFRLVSTPYFNLVDHFFPSRLKLLVRQNLKLHSIFSLLVQLFGAPATLSTSSPSISSSYSSSSSGSVWKYCEEEESLSKASRLCSKRSSSPVADFGDVDVENSASDGVEGCEEMEVKTVKGR